MNLSNRIEKSVMSKFENDKLKAILYLRKQNTFYARKSDSKRDTPYHKQWKAVYQVYVSAELRLTYWYELDNGLYEELEERFEDEYNYYNYENDVV